MANSTQLAKEETTLLDTTLDYLTPDLIRDLTETELQEKSMVLKAEMEKLIELGRGATTKAKWKRQLDEVIKLALPAQDSQLRSLMGPYGAFGNFEVVRSMVVIQMKVRKPIAELVRLLQAAKAEKTRKRKAESKPKPDDDYKERRRRTPTEPRGLAKRVHLDLRP